MPADDGLIRITPDVAVPTSEIGFQASRASGPGGQHVNRSATRIELWWNVAESPSLTEAQRALLLQRLRRRLDRAGRLHLVSGERRSQAQNRAAVLDRLVKVVAAALHVARPRKPTRPPASSVERRLSEKRHRAATKRDRRGPAGDDA